MTAKAGKGRELFHAATGPLPVNEMRNLTSGKIYIRPLQRDIDIDELGLVLIISKFHRKFDKQISPRMLNSILDYVICTNNLVEIIIIL